MILYNYLPNGKQKSNKVHSNWNGFGQAFLKNVSILDSGYCMILQIFGILTVPYTFPQPPKMKNPHSVESGEVVVLPGLSKNDVKCCYIGKC